MRQAAPECEQKAFFRDAEPRQIQVEFTNHASAVKHGGFVTTDKKVYEKWWIIPWTGSGRPRVISSLLVAEGAKRRLYLNTMYVNAHAEYVLYNYEHALQTRFVCAENERFSQ